MFKKAIIATAVLAASTGLALANGGTYQAPHAMHSAYVGVAVSRDSFNVKSDNNNNFFNVDLGNTGWNGELNAGLGWVLQDHYYLGGEIFGTASSAKIDFGALNLKYRYSYGIDFVPGVKISDSTMLYGKVGYVRGNFKVSGLGLSAKNNRNGLQLGIGAETMVTNNVSVKVEYDYNYFKKFDGTNFRPTVNTAKLGVAYHFMSA